MKAFLLSSLFISSWVSSQTLSIGDLVVISYNQSNAEFRLLALADIPSGTVVKITDQGWKNNLTFYDDSLFAEGTLTWTLASNIEAGETFKLTLTFGGPAAITVNELEDNVVRSAEVSLSGWTGGVITSFGDQILVYQGAAPNPSFITGFHDSTSGGGISAPGDWIPATSTLQGSGTTIIPPGLTNSVNALAFSMEDNDVGVVTFANSQTTYRNSLAYNGPTTGANKATWMSRIFDRTNWDGHETNNVVGSISATPSNSAAKVVVLSSNALPALGGTPVDDTAVEDVATAIDVSAYNVSDGDGDTITLTLAVDLGTIASTDGSGTTAGVIVANSGTASMTLQGSEAALNTYLDDTSKITYTTGLNDNTAAVLTVTPNDGTANGTADTVSINITAVNDSPAISNLDGDSFTYAGGAGEQVIDQGAALTLADVDSTDFDSGSLTVTITSGEDAAEDLLSVRTGSGVTLSGQSAASNVSVGGTIVGALVNNISAGNDLVVALNANANASLIATLLGELTYTNEDTVSPTAGARNVRITVNDGDGGTSSNQGVAVTVSGINQAPTITNLNTDSLSYTQGSGVVLIDQGTAATVSDADSADFDTGNLTVAITAGKVAGEDKLAVSNTVTLSGQTAGSNVSVGGTVIGTLVNAVAAGNDFVVNFNTDASLPRVQILTRAVSYENTGAANTTVGSRTIRFTVSDGDGGLSSNNDVSLTVEAAVVTVEPLTFGNLDGDSVNYSEGSGAQQIDGGTALTLSNPSEVSLDGGAVNVIFTNSALAEDFLKFNSAVTLSGQAAGGEVSVAGVVLGTLAEDVKAGNNLGVNLNGNATAANLVSLISAVSYENTDVVNPTEGDRVIQLTLTDGRGVASSAQTVTIKVSAVNEPPKLSGLTDVVNYNSDQGAVALSPAGLVSDSELSDIESYEGAVLQISRTDPVSSDVFLGSGSLANLVEGEALNLNGVVSGTVTTNSNGVLVITFNSVLDQAGASSVLQQITYINTEQQETAVLDITFNDGNAGLQGSGGVGSVSSSITLLFADNVAPATPMMDKPVETNGNVLLAGSAEVNSKIIILLESNKAVDYLCTTERVAADGRFSCRVRFAAGKLLTLMAEDLSNNRSLGVEVQIADGDGVDEEVEEQVLSTVVNKAHLKKLLGLTDAQASDDSFSFVSLFDKRLNDTKTDGVFISTSSNGDEICEFKSVQMIQEGDEVKPDFAEVNDFSVTNDTAFDYPFGLAAYGLSCNRDGAEPLLTLIFNGFGDAQFDSLEASDLKFRKFNSATGQYSMAVSESIEWIEPDTPDLNGRRVLKASFRIKDDGLGDEFVADGSAAGLIYDPIGPAIPAAGVVFASITSDRKQASVGDLIRYQLELSNTSDVEMTGIKIMDSLPRGIKLLPDSVRLLDDSAQVSKLAVNNASRLEFAAVVIPAKAQLTVSYSAVVGSGTSLGSQVNRVVVHHGVRPISNEAAVSVEIVADPVFDRATVIGKVFNDRNGNGIQDAGEEGIAGARLATVKGEWITVDQYGRYHYAGVEVGEKPRGKNFIVKLDMASLPEGAVANSENPRVVRLTKGVMASINFPVQLPIAGRKLGINIQTTALLSGKSLSESAERLVSSVSRALLLGEHSVIELYLHGDTQQFSRLEALLTAALKQQLISKPSLLDKVKIIQQQGKSSNAKQYLKKTLVKGLSSLVAFMVSPVYAEAASVIDLCQSEGWCEVIEQAPADQSNGQLNFAGGKLWLSEVPTQQRADLRVWTEPYAQLKGSKLAQPMVFYAHSNMGEFIQAWQLQLFAAGDRTLTKPLAELAGEKLPLGVGITWGGKLKSSTLKSEKSLARISARRGGLIYRLTIVDAMGRSARTELGRIRLGRDTPKLKVEQKLAEKVLLRSAQEAVSLAENNIKLAGALVQLHGSNLPVGSVFEVNGERHAVADDGQVLVQRQMPPGDHTLTLGLYDQQQKTLANGQLRKKIKGNYFFMVGLADINTSKNSISAKVELDNESSQFDDSVLVEGRLAFFLKGKVKGKYLITAQLDTGESELKNIFSDLHRRDPRNLFKRIDPDRYYPVYGDDSTISRDVDTQGKFYVRLDWDQGQLLWGNYNTGFSGTELAEFNRSLYGAKLDIRGAKKTLFGNVKSQLKTFVSEPDTAAAHDEFEGTGGSLYYLRHQDVALGSAKLSVEVRERGSERLREKTDLLEGRDYSIDEFQGRIILHRPLSGYAASSVLTVINQDQSLDGDQVVLTVDYEYIPSFAGSDKRLTGGVRAKQWFGDHVALGVTSIQQQNGAVDFRKNGVELTLQASQNSHLVIEYAESEAGQNIDSNRSLDGGLSFEEQALAGGRREGSGLSVNAQLELAELTADAIDAQVSAWFRDLDGDFDNQRYQGNSLSAQRSYGVEAEVTLTDKMSIATRYDNYERGDSEQDGNERKTFGAQLNYSLQDSLRLSAEYLRKQERSGNVEFDSDLLGVQLAYQHSDELQLFVKAQTVFDTDQRNEVNNDLAGIGAKYSLSEKLSVEGEYLWGDRDDSARGGISYQLNESNTVFSNYRLSGASSGGQSLVLGQRSKISDRLAVYQEHRFDRNLQEQQRGQSYGFNYQFTEGWDFGADWLEGSVERNKQRFDRSAYSVFASYKAEGVNLSNKLEYRVDENTSDRNKQWLTVNHLKYRLNPSYTLQAKLEFSQTENEQNNSARFGEFDLGLAFRPVDNDRFNMLAMYSYLYDLDPQFSTVKLGEQNSLMDERSHVFSLDGLYQLSDRFQLGGKLAWKKGEIRVGRDQGEFYGSSSRLMVINARYHLMKKWGALLEYRRLTVTAADDDRQGYLLAIERSLNQKIKIALGYNFTDFNDDLTALDYQVKGWFINLIGKY